MDAAARVGRLRVGLRDRARGRHHVQRQLGTSAEVDRAQRDDPDRATSCRSARSSRPTATPASGRTKVYRAGQLEEGDVEEAFRASEAVGDDRLQRNAGGRVNPDAFTHGTSAQRRRWSTRAAAPATRRAATRSPPTHVMQNAPRPQNLRRRYARPMSATIPAATEQISYDDLYARWERGNWRATEIDFSRTGSTGTSA